MNIRKTILILIMVAGVVLFSVLYGDGHYRSMVGKQAPSLELTHNGQSVNLSQWRGEYVLLSFWKSANAPSRRDINLYTAWERSHPESGIKLVGVNLDASSNLFKSIVVSDRLIEADQFTIPEDKIREAERSFGLENGLGTVLIGPDGKIVAQNPSETELDRYAGSGS